MLINLFSEKALNGVVKKSYGDTLNKKEILNNYPLIDEARVLWK